MFFLLLCVQERLLALKRSMSFMQDMDFTQQAAILGDEDLTADLPPAEIIPVPMESAKKSKKQPVKDMKEVIRYSTAEVVHLMLCDTALLNNLLTFSLLLSQLPVWTRGKCVQFDWQYSRGACSGSGWTFCRWSSGSHQQIHARFQGDSTFSLYIHFFFQTPLVEAHVHVCESFIFPFLCFQIGYLHKESDSSLLYTVVNQLDPDAEGNYHVTAL